MASTIEHTVTQDSMEDFSNGLVRFIVTYTNKYYWFQQIWKLCLNIVVIFIIFPTLTIVHSVISAIKWFLESHRIDDLPNRHVVVTGCGSGFGKETAILLARMGLQVHAGVRKNSSIEDLRSEYQGTNLHIDLCDVGSDESVCEYGKKLSRILGSSDLWAVINNAGIHNFLIDEDFLQLEDFKLSMNVNFYGSVRMVKICKPLMNRTRGGRLIFVQSVTSYYPVPYSAAYIASKSALLGYVNALKLEHQDSKITIHSCVSGFFPTKIVKPGVSHVTSSLARLTSQAREMLTEEVCMRRIACNNLQTDLLIMDNKIAMIATALANAVISKWPSFEFWVGWDCTVTRVLAIIPNDCVTWWLRFLVIFSGDNSMKQIERQQRTQDED